MEENYENWSFDDFVLFLLVHAAASDLHISKEEEDHIKSKYTDEHYQEMRNLYKSHTDFDNMLIIHHFKDEVLTSDEEKQKVYDTVEELFHVDGEYSADERNLMVALKTIID